MTEASAEQLAMAAAGGGDREMTLVEYRAGMAGTDYADNLAVVVMAKHFGKALSVISATSSRTYYPDGREEDICS